MNNKFIDNIFIILTSTVNINTNLGHVCQVDINERVSVYLKSVKSWLHETNFNIILVENSGYNFDELDDEKNIYKNRFEVITYNEKESEECFGLKNNKSKGASELFSINVAHNLSTLIREKKTKSKEPVFIIKVTGRYFIPELQNYFINNNLMEYECLTQNNTKRCEMLGCNINLFDKIFKYSVDDVNYLNSVDFIEEIYENRILIYANKILKCKVFDIETTQRGGSAYPYTDI